MKKDKKFLFELEKNLGNIKESFKSEIISKYENIIKEEKEKKKKITVILKDLGDPKEIANNEIEKLGSKAQFSFFDKFKSKIKNIKIKKSQKKPNTKKEKKETRKKDDKINNVKKQSIKNKFESFKKTLTKDISFKKKRKVTDEPKEIVEEIKEEIKDKVAEVSEIVTETHIFESKKDRTKRIIIRTFGVILTTLLLFFWLWITVVFIASLFAYLDGVKIIGINIGLFGLDLLVLWIVIMINRSLFRKKMSLTINLIICVISLLLIAFGIVLTFRQLSKIKTIKDVSVKYSMTTKLSNYHLTSDDDQKFTITFNSNYKTQYTINHDDTLKDRIKVEVKYYECYYDYYAKESSNSAYISLKLDDRDRLSVYINDLKEGMIMDNDELSRYSVKISINSKDASRLVIQD